ncbi:MAG: ornithine carbamoyltransferase [Bdellovibrionota bacterium]
MLKLQNRHLLTGEELSLVEINALLDLADTLAKERRQGIAQTNSLQGKHMVLFFEKPSLRTRLSFTVAMQELGGFVIDSTSATRKSEEPEDLARVLAGYCHAVVARVHHHAWVERLASRSPIPVINGLSDSHHPCQVLADILTLKQRFGSVEGLRLAYVGDGNNMLHSLLLLMPFLGIQVHYACPQGYEPNALIRKRAIARAKEGVLAKKHSSLFKASESVQAFTDPIEAVRDANVVYTDVWTSMGFETEQTDRERAFDGYQLNEEIYSHAAPNALIMHCMPMLRGKEISETLPDHPNSVVFAQSENRLHAQKALLMGLLG